MYIYIFLKKFKKIFKIKNISLKREKFSNYKKKKNYKISKSFPKKRKIFKKKKKKEKVFGLGALSP